MAGLWCDTVLWIRQGCRLRGRSHRRHSCWRTTTRRPRGRTPCPIRRWRRRSAWPVATSISRSSTPAARAAAPSSSRGRRGELCPPAKPRIYSSKLARLKIINLRKFALFNNLPQMDHGCYSWIFCGLIMTEKCWHGWQFLVLCFSCYTYIFDTFICSFVYIVLYS